MLAVGIDASNQAGFGPPDFKDASFELDGKKTVKIRMAG
jgi:uncharacterized protein (DUF2141 family)